MVLLPPVDRAPPAATLRHAGTGGQPGRVGREGDGRRRGLARGPPGGSV